MKKVRIQLTDVSKSYYSETAVTQALRKINLTFCEGEFVAITGESGSGKSTLLNIIGGMDTFDDGEMYIDGEPTFRYDAADWEDYRRNKIGYVFQDYSLIGHYSAIDNVMSALLIMDKDKETSREIAKEYLRQVGLDGLETHRASQLSSGQKQRLSIARALAKDTGIIVADEPTGNLDSETGEQIIQLLAELSKTRLVIMVTHNYDMVEPYATRKIRLHDGEIISDVGGAAETGAGSAEAVDADRRDAKGEDKISDSVSQSTIPGVETSLRNESNVSGKHSKKTDTRSLSRRRNEVAFHFARLNRRTQVGRASLFTAFFLIVSVVSFLFLGELYAYADDTLTKSYDTTAYYNEDETRLAVKRADGSEITDEDVAEISALANVVTVDSCEYCNDINYYYEENTDYQIVYSAQRDWDSTKERYTFKFLNDDHFMRSVSCIDESDLAAGSIPSGLTEIVVYSEDESLIGTTVTMFFRAHNLWGQNCYCSYEMTIVGVLKEDADQIYFSEEFCLMLGGYMDAGQFWLYSDWNDKTQDYSTKVSYIPIIKEDLEGLQVRMGGRTLSEQENGETTFYSSVLFHFVEIDDHNAAITDSATELDVELSSALADNSDDFLEVSSEFYYTYYQPVKTQAAVYITSYAMTDSVMEKLESMGYEVISTYRVSVSGYNETKVNNRMVVIGVSAFGLLVLALAEILILRSLMKIRIKDFFVLKFIGMKLKMINRISYFEMTAHCITAMAITVIAAWILRLAGVGLITDMMWYVRWHTYVLFILYNLAVCVLTVAAFNHLLKGRLNS